MLRHTFVFLAFSLTVAAAQAGSPPVTGSASIKQPPAAATKGSPASAHTLPAQAGKAPSTPAPAAAKPAVSSKNAPEAHLAVSKPQTTSAAVKQTPAVKSIEVKKAPDAPAPESKSAAQLKAELGAKGKAVKPAPKTNEEKKESKAAKGDGSAKEVGRLEHAREPRTMRASLVPPPPPETPAILGAPAYGGNGFYMMQGFMPVETLSPDALRARQKQLIAQLQNVKDLMKDRQAKLSEKTDRAKQFEGLYQEGVISRRELEASQEDIKMAQRDCDDSKARVDDVQMALNRVGDKLKTIAKYGSHPNKHLAAGSQKKVKLKHADVSAQADQANGTKTALKPAGVNLETASPSATKAVAPTKGVIPTQSVAPATSTTVQSATSVPAAKDSAAVEPANATPESDSSPQLSAPAPAQAAR